MPILVNWYVPSRIVDVISEGIIDGSELKMFNQQMLEMLENGEKPVHMLDSLDSITKIPFDFRAMSQALTFLRHANMGYVITYASGQSYIVLRMSEWITKLFGVKYKHFRTREEAIKFLKDNDETLSTLSSEDTVNG